MHCMAMSGGFALDANRLPWLGGEKVAGIGARCVVLRHYSHRNLDSVNNFDNRNNNYVNISNFLISSHKTNFN